MTAPPPGPAPGTAQDRERVTLLVLPDPDALRDHLDALNESGTRTQASGVDRYGNPFLIALAGPYAETEDVIFGSPWDGEVDYNNGLRCEQCNASNLHEIGDLNYPVTVIAALAAPSGPQAAASIEALCRFADGTPKVDSKTVKVRDLRKALDAQ